MPARPQLRLRPPQTPVAEARTRPRSTGHVRGDARRDALLALPRGRRLPRGHGRQPRQTRRRRQAFHHPHLAIHLLANSPRIPRGSVRRRMGAALRVDAGRLRHGLLPRLALGRPSERLQHAAAQHRHPLGARGGCQLFQRRFRHVNRTVPRTISAAAARLRTSQRHLQPHHVQSRHLAHGPAPHRARAQGGVRHAADHARLPVPLLRRRNRHAIPAAAHQGGRLCAHRQSHADAVGCR